MGEYSVVVRDAVILLEFAGSAIGADWKSAMLKVKVIAATFFDDLRAHESGAYQKLQGVWTKCAELSNLFIARLEEGTRAAIALLMNGGVALEDVVENGTLSGFLGDLVTHTNLAAEGTALLRQADKALHARGEEHGGLRGWSKATLAHLSNILPVWSRCGDTLFKDYCRWAFTPRPPSLTYVHECMRT